MKFLSIFLTSLIHYYNSRCRVKMGYTSPTNVQGCPKKRQTKVIYLWTRRMMLLKIYISWRIIFPIELVGLVWDEIRKQNGGYTKSWTNKFSMKVVKLLDSDFKSNQKTIHLKKFKLNWWIKSKFEVMKNILTKFVI